MLPFAFFHPLPWILGVSFLFARIQCNLLAKWELPLGKGSQLGREASPHSELSCI